MKRRKVLIETFNGDGYSDPEIIKINSQEELDESMKKLLELYPEGDFKREWSNNNYNVTFDDNTDQGAIQLIEVFKDMKALIQVMPDINEVMILAESEDENKLLLLLEEVAEDNNFEDEDLAQYVMCEHKHILSSHGDNGFYHLEIV